MISSVKLILDTTNYFNHDLMEYYCKKFELLEIKSTEFIAGTMFWVRSTIYEDFFSRFDPLAIRDQVLQNYEIAHIMERIFGYIITNYGYSISGWQNKKLYL